MIDLNKVPKILEEVNKLQAEILNCKDDKRAIQLQTQLVELLKDVFEDEDLLASIMLAGQLNKSKEDNSEKKI